MNEKRVGLTKVKTRHAGAVGRRGPRYQHCRLPKGLYHGLRRSSEYLLSVAAEMARCYQHGEARRRPFLPSGDVLARRHNRFLSLVEGVHVRQVNGSHSRCCGSSRCWTTKARLKEKLLRCPRCAEARAGHPHTAQDAARARIVPRHATFAGFRSTHPERPPC